MPMRVLFASRTTCSCKEYEGDKNNLDQLHLLFFINSIDISISTLCCQLLSALADIGSWRRGLVGACLPRRFMGI